MLKAIMAKISGIAFVKVVLPAVVMAALGAVAYVYSLKSTIQDQADALAVANATAAVCSANNTGLRATIGEQNAQVDKLAQQSEAMQERQQAAREEAQEAQETAREAIKRMRAEEVRTQTCEQARQALIREAIGYVF